MATGGGVEQAPTPRAQLAGEVRRLVLLASPTLRRGPLSPLQLFVRDYEDFLRQFEIVTTEGCRRALLRSGLLQNHPRFKAELPGYLGGIVHLSALVVAPSKRVEAVVYFIDPRDPSSIFPETNAIKRECVVHKVTFLSTSRAARDWATISWGHPPPHFINAKDLGNLRLVRSLGEETIALIAHDGKKKELLQFAQDHFAFLLRFRRRVATGTTGGLLNGGEPDPGRLEPAECKELAPVCTELASLILSAKETGKLQTNEHFVDEQPSGPKGGDIAIAEMVLAGDCQRIVFFENPLKPHEHTEDIQLLERTGRLRGKATICVHDHRTAAWFANRWESAAQAGDAQPLLLSFVIERLFGAKAILVPTKKRWPDTWEGLREAAGWFVLSQIAMLANERKKVADNVRVVVSWGVGSSQITEELASRLKRLKALESKAGSRGVSDQENLEESAIYGLGGFDPRRQAPPLGDERYFRPGNVIVSPIQGLVGSEDEEVEATEIARRLAKFFGGRAVPLAANVLVRGGGDEDRRNRRKERFEEVYAHWSNTDIVVATAGPLAEEYEDRPLRPHFVGYTQDMEKLGACGDLGGLFLDPWGRPVVGDRFERVGMASEEIKAVRGRRGVVVVAGAQHRRTEITLAALIGGWVSVLLTDSEFAFNLVGRVRRLVTEGELKLLPPDTDGPLVKSARF